MKFGKLTVIRLSVENEKGKPKKWACVCDCDPEREVTVLGSDLRRGGTKSCGCYRKMINTKDLTGQKFNRLTVLERAGNNKSGRSLWKCKCDCGREDVIAIAKNLLNGGKQSCGCLNIDNNIERSTTHGDSKSRMYSIYRGMLQRCNNPNFKYSIIMEARGLWYRLNGQMLMGIATLKFGLWKMDI